MNKPKAEQRVSLATIRRLLSYDPDTGVLRWRVNRRGYRGIKAGDEAGTVDRKGYRSIRVCQVALRASRIAWALHHGRWPRKLIDHRDGDRLNNRIDNLREASVSQNGMNSKRRVDSTTGVKGVRRMQGRWQARIVVARKTIHLGTYDSIEAAAAARLAGEIEHHGDWRVGA